MYKTVLAPDEEGVVAGDRDVVQEHAGVRRAPDRDAIVVEGEALPARPPPERITSAAPCLSTTSSMSTWCISPDSSTV